MNSRKLVNLSFMTLVIGGVVGLVARLIMSWGFVMEYISPFNGFELFGIFLAFIGLSLTFSVVSMAGFLAYVFINRFGKEMLRGFWPLVQVVLVVLVLIQIVFVSNKDIALGYRIAVMLFVLIAAIIVTFLKVKQTNKSAIIPAMFFMVVITALELTLVLRTSDMDYIISVTITLIVANAYQLIMWHHVTKPDPEHTRRINERRELRGKQTFQSATPEQAVKNKPNKSKKRKKKRK